MNLQRNGFVNMFPLYRIIALLIKESNHWIKYFLYLSMLRCRMSSIGPSKRLNASLSIDTTLQSLSAFTLACLTVFFTKAISPKQSPSLYSNTFLGGAKGDSFFSAISLPSAMIQNLSPCSPCLTIQEPASNSSSLRLSQSCSFSQGSISARMSTLERISEQYFLFLVADSCTMWLKVALSSPNSFPAVLHLMEAALGALYMRANSPKKSPALQVFRQVCFQFMILKQSYSPSSMMQRVSPFSPSVMMDWPGWADTSSMASITMPKSSLLRDWKSMDFSMSFLISSLVAASLGMTFWTYSAFLLKSPKHSALIPCRLFFFSIFFFFFSWSFLRNSACISSVSSSESE